MSEVRVRAGAGIREAESRNRKSEKRKAATLLPLRAEEGATSQGSQSRLF